MRRTATYFMLASVLLSSCTTMTYFNEGQKYNSKEEFAAARNAMQVRCLASVSPHPIPLVNRKLVAMIPTQEAVYRNRYSIIKAALPNDPVTIEKMRDNPLFSNISEGYRQRVEQIKRKNIYTSVEVVEYETLSAPQASSDMDVLYVFMAEVLGGRDSFYLNTKKSGKQIVNYDTSRPICEAFRDSIFSSIQSIALQ